MYAGAVVLSASSRHYDAAQRAAADLASQGLRVLTPNFVLPETEVDVEPETKRRLTRDFLTQIDSADALYVVAPGGYVGMSVALEVGYAHALGLPIYLSEPTAEEAINVVAAGVIALADLRSTPLAARTASK